MIMATTEFVVRKSALLLPWLLVLPLSAQSYEVGLFAGQQSFKSASYADPTGEGDLNASSGSKTVVAARVGYALVDMGPALLQVTAGYQPKVTTTLTTSAALYGFQSSQDYGASSASLGLMANFKAVIAVGAGVEYRDETLSSNGVSTRYGRPWGRVNAGYAVPSPILKPFVGVEVALPLTSKSLSGDASTADQLQALAPKLEVGLYGGIRF